MSSEPYWKETLVDRICDEQGLDRRVATVALEFIGKMNQRQLRVLTSAATAGGMSEFELAYAMAEKTDPR